MGHVKGAFLTVNLWLPATKLCAKCCCKSWRGQTLVMPGHFVQVHHRCSETRSDDTSAATWHIHKHRSERQFSLHWSERRVCVTAWHFLGEVHKQMSSAFQHKYIRHTKGLPSAALAACTPTVPRLRFEHERQVRPRATAQRSSCGSILHAVNALRRGGELTMRSRCSEALLETDGISSSFSYMHLFYPNYSWGTEKKREISHNHDM